MFLHAVICSVLSTEQALYNIEGLNQRITKGEIDSSQMMIGSLDVTNLYGSTSVKKATELVRQRVLEIKWSLEPTFVNVRVKSTSRVKDALQALDLVGLSVG